MNKRLLLLILPIAVFVLSIFVVLEREPYYSCWSDPPYCYLFNGLNIASGHFEVGQVDHPGTPLQLFAGGAIKLLHLFRSEKDIVRDVLSHPEWYLLRIGILQSFIVALCMLLSGMLMFRFMQNIFYSLLIQLTGIISFHALFFSQNLMTEFILTTTGILLAPLLVQYSFDSKEEGRSKIFPSAFIMGIMLAGKISSFPVFLLWLFIMKSSRHLAIFVSVTVLSFLLFTIPAWHAAKEFFGFMSNISTHTGKYGGGKTGIVVWSEFFEHLKILLTDSYYFTSTFAVLTLIVLTGLIRFMQKQKFYNASHDRILVAIWLIMLLQLFIVSKHFAQHYMVPVHLLLVPAWVILIHHFWRKFPSGKVHLILSNTKLQVASVFLFTAFVFYSYCVRYNFFPHFEQPGKQIAKRMANEKYDLALFDCNVTGPFPQIALLFGVGYSGHCASLYNSYLQKIYSPFYWINKSNNKLRNFSGEFAAADAMADSDTVLFYSDNPLFDIASFKLEDKHILVDSILLKYRHPLSGEQVYIVTLKMK
jgi:hypothetical protein